MNSIKMIDAPCGQGKTKWAIQEMNAHPEKRYIYCAPLLDGVDEIRKYCGKHRFWEPHPFNASGSKFEDLHCLLAKKQCIAVTHATFLKATPETIGLIKEGGYTLIMDEAPEVITEFNALPKIEQNPRQSIRPGDLKILFEKNMITTDPSGLVSWQDQSLNEDHKFDEVERYAKAGQLYCSRQNSLYVMLDPAFWDAFDEVYIMTYLFKNSLLHNYFHLYGIVHEPLSVEASEDGTRRLVPFDPDIDKVFRKKCAELIHICDNDRMNDYKETDLSHSWYQKASKDERMNVLKNHLSNYFNRYLKHPKPYASQREIMWTCIGEYKDKLCGRGYTAERKLAKEERKLPEEEKNKIKSEISCFVPCNAKASNSFRSRWALAYGVNMYLNPYLKALFNTTPQDTESPENEQVLLDEDLFAASCMIQWIMRSRIRDGLPVELYIPSPRMRRLLTAWLDEKL